MKIDKRETVRYFLEEFIPASDSANRKYKYTILPKHVKFLRKIRWFIKTCYKLIHK